MGREGFVWAVGVVEDRNDPLYLGRCKVRYLGWHTRDKLELPTKTLPWSFPLMPLTSASQTQVGTSPTGPVPGTWVLSFFKDGEDASSVFSSSSFVLPACGRTNSDFSSFLEIS